MQLGSLKEGGVTKNQYRGGEGVRGDAKPI